MTRRAPRSSEPVDDAEPAQQALELTYPLWSVRWDTATNVTAPRYHPRRGLRREAPTDG